MSDSHSGKHHWTFFRSGGLEQVSLDHGGDIGALKHLDQKLWVALSSPAKGLEFDTRTLEMIDLDKDGRVRAPEIIAAGEWAAAHLKNADELLNPAAALPLSSINDQTESGAKLLAGAKRILQSLGKENATSITVEDLTDTARIFAQTRLNGDGIVPADAAADPEVQKVIGEIIDTLGAITDRSGKPGINTDKLNAFYAEAEALTTWHRTGQSDSEILPLGDKTAAAFDALKAVRQKVDDYFARCLLAAFDSRAAGPLNRSESEFTALAKNDLTANSEEISRLPLAHIAADKPLPLTNNLNPAWKAVMETFRTAAVVPLLGEKTELTQEDWSTLKGRLAKYESWMASKPATATEKLGIARLEAILSGNAKAQIANLIQDDLGLEEELNQITAVERLVRYYRDLHLLMRNFVNFADFYHPTKPAIFQTGTLYVDGRSCDLCVAVEDVGKHSTLAAGSGIYLAYCELNRTGNPPRTICAAVTTGFAETLWVGRNGIFYDRQGRDWDATIIKIVEHQISLKEAFWAPWKKIAKMISDQINKMLAAKEEAALAAAGKTVDQASKSVEAGKPPAAPVPQSGAALASSVAAIGIAVGLLGGAIGKLLEFVKDATLLNIILGILCVIGAVSLPSVLIAYFKLRKRDVAPILNACGWAVNRRIRMTLKLGHMLTKEATLPPDSHRKLLDPYADNNGRRNFLLTVLVIVLAGFLWYIGQFDSLLPQPIKSTTVLGTNAPAAPKPEPASGNTPAPAQ